MLLIALVPIVTALSLSGANDVVSSLGLRSASWLAMLASRGNASASVSSRGASSAPSYAPRSSASSRTCASPIRDVWSVTSLSG